MKHTGHRVAAIRDCQPYVGRRDNRLFGVEVVFTGRTNESGIPLEDINQRSRTCLASRKCDALPWPQGQLRHRELYPAGIEVADDLSRAVDLQGAQRVPTRAGGGIGDSLPSTSCASGRFSPSAI